MPPVGIKVEYLSEGVDACVSPSATMNADGPLEDRGQTFFYFILNPSRVRLALPSVKRTTIIRAYAFPAHRHSRFGGIADHRIESEVLVEEILQNNRGGHRIDPT